LARRTRAEAFRQRRGGKARLGDRKTAGGILVEPMDEARALAIRARCAQRLEHAVDVARRAGAALYRKSHRLVEDHHVGVLIERDRAQVVAGLCGRLVAQPARRWRIKLERRGGEPPPGPSAAPSPWRAFRYAPLPL